MAIKRVTIELDDSPDITNSTSIPSSLIGKEIAPIASERTTTPEQQADYQHPEGIIQKQDNAVTTETIGRTPSDLIFAFINRPEFIAVLLLILSFVIFIGEINQPKDFWLPLLAGTILNIVWFGICVIRHLVG